MMRKPQQGHTLQLQNRSGPVCKSAWPIFLRATRGAGLAGLGAGLSGFLAQQPETKGENPKLAQINIS
jgi:hypothetical protein